MGLPYSGQISMGDVASELDGPTYNQSLTNMSVSVGFTPEHGLKEFYGYSRPPARSVVFSNYYSIGYTGSVSGVVTITGGNVNFGAAVTLYSAGTCNTAVNISGSIVSYFRKVLGNGYSTTTFQKGPGQHAYTLDVNLTGSGSGWIYANWADTGIDIYV